MHAGRAPHQLSYFKMYLLDMGNALERTEMIEVLDSSPDMSLTNRISWGNFLSKTSLLHMEKEA